MGAVGAGSGEDGGEGSAGAGSQPASRGCTRALGENMAPACVAPISTHAGAGEVAPGVEGNSGGFGSAGSSGETEAHFAQEHWDRVRPNRYPAAQAQ